MKQILYFKLYEGASEFYRLLPLTYIDDVDLKIVETRDANINFQYWDRFDMFIILRPQGEVAVNLIKTLKRWGKKVIADFDDNPLALDQHNPMFSLYENEKKSTIQCIALADEIWVSTPAIKDAFRMYNKNIHVIPNSLDDYTFPVSEKKPYNFNKKAIWRGGSSHEGDMYELGTPEKVISLVNGNKDWQFLFFGQRFHYLEKRTGENYVAVPCSLPMVQFQEAIQKENACVAFYPLSTTRFNKSKSNIFWIESTYAGSAVFANKELDEFNMPGVADLEKLPEMLNKNLKARHDISWEYIKSNLLVSKINLLRIERLKA